jgi:peptidoglycan hydrolase-like protein with peptidoglycan-binding domain
VKATKKVHSLLAGCLALVAILAVSGVRYARSGTAGPSASGRPVAAAKVTTAKVVTTDLSDYQVEEGALGYRKGRTIRGLGDGLVTWLPKSGTSVTRGKSLFRVDDRPVSLFYGTTPLFRELRTVGTVGRDVKVVAENLKALGYGIGSQPAAGTWVTVTDELPPDPAPDTKPNTKPDTKPDPTPSAKPVAQRKPYQVRVTAKDGVFTVSLKAAVKRWQSNKGMRPTGVLEFGDILVLPEKVRIGAVTAQPGDVATESLMTVTASTKTVTVSVGASEVDAVEVGDKVRITLPDSSHTSGTVGSVSTSVKPGEGDDGDQTAEPQIDVTILFDKPSKVRKLSSAQVEVRFTGTTKSDVLAVPVGALLALSGGGYGVQISGGALTPVETGFFADGMVEITGPGIAEGTSVVTTS